MKNSIRSETENDTPAVIDREKICPEKSFLKVEKQAEKEQKKHSC